MLSPNLIQLALYAVLAIIVYQLLKHGLKGIVALGSMSAVIIAIAPGSYAAAKAQAALPTRELTGPLAGDRKEAALFNKIVQDRLRRTRIGQENPDFTVRAALLGHRLAA